VTAGLLDEFEIHLVPVLLGDGVRRSAASELGRSSWSEQ
jgi:hypothetical protein